MRSSQEHFEGHTFIDCVSQFNLGFVFRSFDSAQDILGLHMQANVLKSTNTTSLSQWVQSMLHVQIGLLGSGSPLTCTIRVGWASSSLPFSHRKSWQRRRTSNSGESNSLRVVCSGQANINTRTSKIIHIFTSSTDASKINTFCSFGVHFFPATGSRGNPGHMTTHYYLLNTGIIISLNVLHQPIMGFCKMHELGSWLLYPELFKSAQADAPAPENIDTSGLYRRGKKGKGQKGQFMEKHHTTKLNYRSA